MSTRVNDLGTILSVWAHPDDETYLAGALMAEAIARGQRVDVRIAHGGRARHSTTRSAGRRRGSLACGDGRRPRSMAVLGVTDHRVLDLPDGGLADMEPTEGVALVHRLMQETVPDTIVTFAPDGMTFHRDHVTVSQWVTEAWEEAGRPARLLHATATDDHLRRSARSTRRGELHDRPAPHGHAGRRPRRPPRGRGARPRPEARRAGGHGVADERRDGQSPPALRRDGRRGGLRRVGRDSSGSRFRRAVPAQEDQGGVVGEVRRLVLEHAARPAWRTISSGCAAGPKPLGSSCRSSRSRPNCSPSGVRASVTPSV